MKKVWPFKEAANIATFVSKHLFSGDAVCYAYHDWEDGSWQFLPNRGTQQSDVMLVCLEDVYKLDTSIGEPADLPPGWMAKRDGPFSPWSRSKDHPYPVFADDGYYLDDATQYERLYPDICQIPKELDRKTLRAGDLVKLIFRFANEWSPRKDNECERMWVQVLAADEYDLNYQGKLLSTPHLHSAIGEGHELWFHPLHVFALERAGDQIE